MTPWRSAVIRRVRRYKSRGEPHRIEHRQVGASSVDLQAACRKVLPRPSNLLPKNHESALLLTAEHPDLSCAGLTALSCMPLCPGNAKLPLYKLQTQGLGLVS